MQTLADRDVQRGAARGLAEAPGRALSAAEVIGRLIGNPRDAVYPTVSTPQPDLAPVAGPQLAAALGDLTGIPPYTDGPGAVAQEALGSLGPAALFAPLAGAGWGLAALFGGSAAGSGVGEVLRQRGHGGLVQFAGDVAADTLTGALGGPGAMLAAAPVAITRRAAKKTAKKVPAKVQAALDATTFREVPLEEFAVQRDIARARPGRGPFLSNTSVDTMRETNTRTFLSKDGLVGYAIDGAGDAQMVFNMGKGTEPARQNAGKFAVIDAIKNGARKLDAFEGHLTNDLYPLFGFSETDRMKWAQEYAPDEWDYAKYGEPDVVYMAREPGAEPMRLEDAPQTLDRTAMRSRYPRVVLPETGIDKTSGKLFLKKGASPEAKELMTLRDQIGEDIKAGNYEPFFPVAERYDVDPTKYNRPEATTKKLPKKPETVARWRKAIDTPEARTRLKAAYERGLSEMSKNWYMLGQLEKQYIDRLGPEAGRSRFLEHVEGVAATTGGNDPTSNWLMARFAAFEKAKGRKLKTVGGLLPSPIGGRYAGSNAETFNNLIFDKMGIEAIDNPKRYDFVRNFLGQVDSGTIDEQMTRLITPDLTVPRAPTKKQIAAGEDPGVMTYKELLAPEGDTYGIYQDIIRETAKELGVDPRMLQEVAWAGAKQSEGKPMIEHINESIERTSRITGLSPQEVVNGWIDETLPAFTIVGGAGIAGQERRREKEKK